MIFVLQFTEPQTQQTMFENIENGLESSRTAGATSGRNQGAGSRSRRNQGAAVEADAIGEQQLKWTQSGSSSRSGCDRGAVEVDTIGEQQLCTESCLALDYSRRRTMGKVAERAKLLVHIIIPVPGIVYYILKLSGDHVHVACAYMLCTYDNMTWLMDLTKIPELTRFNLRAAILL